MSNWFKNLINSVVDGRPDLKEKGEVILKAQAEQMVEKPPVALMATEDGIALLRRGQEVGRAVINKNGRFVGGQPTTSRVVQQPIVVDPTDTAALLASMKNR